MRKFIIVIALTLIGSATYAQGKLEVVVSNIKSAKGTINVALFSDPDTFLKTPAIGKIVKAEAGSVTVVFDNVPAGEYGISAIHDENENGEIDSNMIGIPKEGFGFGNNSMGTFGPPSFNKAKVTIGSESIRNEISLKYM